MKKTKIAASLLLVIIILAASLLTVAETPSLEDAASVRVDIDPKKPLATILQGMYTVQLKIDDSTNREALHYIPEGLLCRQPAVAIGIPSNTDSESFISSTGWKDLADEKGFSLILLVANEKGWSYDDIGYVRAAINYMNDRDYVQMQNCALYIVGYGDSANAVMAGIAEESQLLAGGAAFGVDTFDTKILDNVSTEQSAAPDVMKSEVALPVWMGVKEKTENVETLITYWKHANELTAEPMSSSYADEIYLFEAYKAMTNELTDAHCASVNLTIGLDNVLTPAFTAHLYTDFLYRTRRQDFSDIGALRPFANNIEKGMDFVEMEVDGTAREFYIFVPSAIKSGKITTKVPVVFVFHGANGTGDDIAARTNWDKVAEEKNFIAVFPTGSRTNNKVKIATAWDDRDIPFFKEMRTYLIENYNVDSTRIYVSGQSAGCGMAGRVALVCPELIAASAASSMMIDMSTVENVNTTYVMPIMVSNGDKDEHFVEGGDAYGTVPGRVAQIISRYGIKATEEETFSYQNGNFHGYDFKNAQGVTVFREQWVTDKVHAFIPDEAYSEYDFMSAYSRGEDGTCYYMGIAVDNIQ